MTTFRSLVVRRSWVGRFLRYSAGSIAATLVSSGVLAVCFRVGHLGAQSSAIVAFIAGAIVAFVVNRTWAWNRRDKAGIGRDFGKYAIIAIVTALCALASVTVADNWASGQNFSDDARTLIAEGAYFGSYAVTFTAKFLLLDRYVFGPTRESDTT